MNLLLILPNAISISEVDNILDSEILARPKVSILTCVGYRPIQIPGLCTGELEQILFLTEHRHGIKTLLHVSIKMLRKAHGRWQVLSRIYSLLFWMLFPVMFGHAFLSAVESFDPDIVDLRYLPANNAVKKSLSESLPNVKFLSEGTNLETAHSLKSYDPHLKVSIVLPIYNGARYLRQSIESCLSQTHVNIELIVVDDCSTDSTPSIIKEYESDNRVVALRNERNLGLPSALNVGFAHCTGELLTWTSHDNWYANDAIHTLVEYLCTNQDVDFVYSAFYVLDAKDRFIDPGIAFLAPPWKLAYFNVVGACFLYRRKVYDDVGEFRPEMEGEEDYDYWVRVYLRGFRMKCLNFPLYYYRRRSESIGGSYVRKYGAFSKVRREYFGQPPIRKKMSGY